MPLKPRPRPHPQIQIAPASEPLQSSILCLDPCLPNACTRVHPDPLNPPKSETPPNTPQSALNPEPQTLNPHGSKFRGYPLCLGRRWVSMGRRLLRQFGSQAGVMLSDLCRLFSGQFSKNIGALIITNTIWGVPYYKYSIIGPKTLF